MKFNLLIFSTAILLASCGGNSSPAKAPGTTAEAPYDSTIGIGKYTTVDVSPTINEKMVAGADSVYKVKCNACHKLTDERLVGPGWKGITSRRTAVWIMNYITNPNPDQMIEKDPELKRQLEICLTRMPFQNITDDQARNIYELMRKNDGVK